MRGSSGDEMLPAVVHRLLPTPTRTNHNGNTHNNRGEPLLPGVVHRLLPTPTAVEYGNNQGGAAGRIGAVRPGLGTIVRQFTEAVDWREYATAIRRWESAIGRPAPYPAALGPRGGVKPAPEFVEWMMGLPAGRVSSVPGLSVNDRLKLLGNGVVPHHAEYAIRYLANTSGENDMTSTDTASFFTTRQTRDVPRDQYGRYKIPDPVTGENRSWTRATTFAATLAEQYGLTIWKQRQVVWGLSRRPDLLSMASTISGPEDKKALGEIVDEAHIAAGTKAKANRGTAIHLACAAAERGAFEQVPEEFRTHVANYFAKLREHGLQVLPQYVERTGIVERYGVAGTFDNLVQCPDGRIRVLDKKTGRDDFGDVEIAVQLAVYAHLDALFDYDGRRFEQLPEIADDYAIVARIDPDTGHTELQRVNIRWGWEWARTCAEVRDIRSTKHVITPMIPPEQPTGNYWQSVANEADAADRAAAFAQPSMPNVTSLPEFVPAPGVPFPLPAVPGAGSALAQQARAQYGETAQLSVSRSTSGEFTAVVDPSSVPPVNGHATGTVPGGFVDTTSSVLPEFQAFWTDNRHGSDDDHDDATATLHGMPVAQYGQPASHPCATGMPCEFTGQEGLHADGTVCLYGSVRPGPVPATAAPTAEVVPDPSTPEVSSPTSTSAPSSPDPASANATTDGSAGMTGDEMVAEILKLKNKAKVQAVARRLMQRIGIDESAPDGIKLNQYQSKVANAAVTLAYNRGVPVPGVDDDAPDYGVPTTPGNATPAKPAGSKKASSGDPARDKALRPAIASIMAQTSVAGLQSLHDHYQGTTLGWTDEMQAAARTRAEQLDAVDGTSPLDPLSMIKGATSRETLRLAHDKATNGGANPGGWTEEMQAAATMRLVELTPAAPVATSGNQ